MEDKIKTQGNNQTEDKGILSDDAFAPMSSFLGDFAENIRSGKELPMKWFKFLIYFSLFFGALMSISSGVQLLLGLNYINEGVQPEMIYALYGVGLKICDRLCGVLMIVIGVMLIYTRFRLAAYKKNGPLFLYITYLCDGAVSVGYALGVGAVCGNIGGVLIPSILQVITTLVVVILNKQYFTNRKELFS